MFLSTMIAGCSSPRLIAEQITITVATDYKEIKTSASVGTTVRDALNSAQISLGELDRVTPSLNEIINENLIIKVTRVREEYYTRKQVIPFEHQVVQSEILPDGERRLSQVGSNGLEEITYHRVFEDGVEVSNNIYKTNVLISPLPEVELIGSQPLNAGIQIPGIIAYISAGNAWIIEGNTNNRELVVSTGDLDGRIFSLSPNGEYLVFTRKSDEATTINTLWMAILGDYPVTLIDLGVKNVIQFAQINPGSNEIAYSTVNWRDASPGWQANNDLITLSLDAEGKVIQRTVVIEANSGGVYGWWGMEFSWSPDSNRLIYIQPDEIGLIDNTDFSILPIHNFSAYQTGGDWAWLPGSAWSPDGSTIYSVDHESSTLSGEENKDEFDLIAIQPKSGRLLRLTENVGMFAYPVPSPMGMSSSFLNDTTEIATSHGEYSLAYLQAINPLRSEESDYQLCVIDRDGSNLKSLFPSDDETGLVPQHVQWSPESINSQGEFMIAFTYNGNIWFVNTVSGVAQQISGDGMTSRIDWR